MRALTAIAREMHRLSTHVRPGYYAANLGGYYDPRPADFLNRPIAFLYATGVKRVDSSTSIGMVGTVYSG